MDDSGKSTTWSSGEKSSVEEDGLSPIGWQELIPLCLTPDSRSSCRFSRREQINASSHPGRRSQRHPRTGKSQAPDSTWSGVMVDRWTIRRLMIGSRREEIGVTMTIPGSEARLAKNLLLRAA